MSFFLRSKAVFLRIIDRRFQMIKKILSIVLPVSLFLLCFSLSLSAYLTYRRDYLSVPVASHQLSQRNEVTSEDFTWIKVPKAILSEDVFLDEEDILGKYIRLSYSLAKGSLFYKGALEQEIKDLSLTLLKSGEVSYDLYTSEVKINTGNLGVGLNVDLYLTIKTNEHTVSDLLIENCRIIGLFDTQGKAIKSYDYETRIAIVSIAVEKDYVSLINKALMAGSLNVLYKDNSYDTDIRSRLNEEAQVLIYLQ